MKELVAPSSSSWGKQDEILMKERLGAGVLVGRFLGSDPTKGFGEDVLVISKGEQSLP